MKISLSSHGVCKLELKHYERNTQIRLIRFVCDTHFLSALSSEALCDHSTAEVKVRGPKQLFRPFKVVHALCPPRKILRDRGLYEPIAGVVYFPYSHQQAYYHVTVCSALIANRSACVS